MIELYTWGTPNGRKVSVMLEECGLAYNLHKINIGAGEQFAPDYLAINPNGKIPSIVDPDGPDGIGRDPDLSLCEDRQIPAEAGPGQIRGAAMADAPDGPHRPDVRPGAPLPALRKRARPLRDRALHEGKRQA